MLKNCTKMVSKDGSLTNINESNQAYLNEVIHDMSSRGLRTLLLAYGESPELFKEQPALDTMVL